MPIVNRRICFSPTLKNLFHDLNNNRNNHADNNHGGDWKIKAKVLFFNSDIAGQAAYPMKFIMKKVNDYSN
jgi:hypothetical protein